MHGVIAVDEIGRLIGGDGGKSTEILGELGVAGTEAEDVAPGGSSRIGQFVGCNSYNGAIDVVQLFDSKRESTRELVVDIGKAETGEWFRPGVATQRMEIYVIDVKEG